VELWWNDTAKRKPEVLGGKPVPVPFCPSLLLYGRGVRGERPPTNHLIRFPNLFNLCKHMFNTDSKSLFLFMLICINNGYTCEPK
jgi:hypothetical protein